VDEERVVAVVQAHAPDVLAYLERRTTSAEDAADVLSDTLSVAWRRVDDLPDDDTRARMWLFATARHTLANHRRGRRRADELTARLRSEMEAAHRSSAVAGPDLQAEAVRRSIEQLPPGQREVVTLLHWDGFSLVQAAELLGLSPSTARSHYAAARKNLQRFLEEDRARKEAPQHRLVAAVDQPAGRYPR